MPRLFLFFISPFFTFLLTLKHGLRYKPILILMFGIYGFTAVFKPGYDIHTNMLKYEMYQTYTSEDILNHFWNTLIFNKIPGYFDEIFMHSIGALLSFFQAPKYVFTGIIGLIYGYFFVGTFYIMLKKINQVSGGSKISHLPSSIVLLFVLLTLWQAFEGINGVRFWTAMWIYFYSIFNYFETKKVKYILLSLTSIGFHFSFIIFSFLFLFFLITRFNFKLIYLIYAISFIASFASESDFTSLRTGSSTIDNRIESYSYDITSFKERREHRNISNSQKSFHARYSYTWMQFFLKYYFLLSISILAYMSSYISKEVKWFASLFCLLFTFSNVFYMIPELSSRIYRVSVVIGLFTIIYSKLKHYILLKKSIGNLIFKLPLVFSPVFLLFYFTRLSINFEVMSIYVLFPPFFFPFLSETNIAIKEAIKSLLM